LVGAAGLALSAILAVPTAFAQFSTPYDPDFAPTPSEAPAPAPAAPAPTPFSAPEPAPSVPQTEEPVAPVTVPVGAAKSPFRLVDRADPNHVLEPLRPSPASGGAPAPSTEMTLSRYQRVRDQVDRGEEPGSEPTNAPGPGWTASIPDLSISTEAPKPPPPEVELPTYGTSLSVTGRKVIGFNFSEKRYTNAQTTSGRAKTTNLIEINQQLQLRMQGKVGPKITVNVDYDDTKTNQQDISVVYNGDPNEVVQNVSFGDIDLSLPSTEFVAYNKQLFGIRADIKYKGFKGTVIGSRTKGTTKSKQFLGNSQFVSVDFLDTAYLRRQYYDVTFGVPARLPLRAGTERVYLARQDPTQTTNVNLQTLTVDDVACNSASCVNFGSTTFTGSFLTLVAGQDYTINYAKGYIQFRNQLQPQFVVAVDYVDAAGNALRFQTSTTTIQGGGSGNYKLIKTPSDLPLFQTAASTPTEAGYYRELKTFYSIGQTSIVRDNGRGNFFLKVLDPSTRKEIGSGLLPIQKYPDTINVDFENGIFQLVEPFSVSNASPTTPDPNIYSQTPISQRIIHVDYNYRFKTFNLEPNLVVQSELVILDGQKLNRNVDYFIDYEAGFITFFNPDRILTTSEIDITYEVAAFAGATNDTLLGGRISHEFNEHYALGGTVLYDAGAKSQTVPQVTELAKSLFVYEFDGQVKKIQIGKKLTLTLQGEFAQSRQNLNLNQFALIDNMEGVKQEDSTPLLANSWLVASNPSAIPSDPTGLSWTSEDFNILQINPHAQATANETQKVLDFHYDFNAPGTSEVSIVYPFSISGVDMSQRTILEVVMLGDASLNSINFHLGGIDENADGTSILRTEDANNDGILQPGEDIGFTYNPAGKGSTRYGASNGILDTEDLNKNGRLDPQDFTGGDFGYIPDGNNPTNGLLFDATTSSTRTVVDFGGSQWHTFQIPLNISSATANLWTNIKQIRISVSHTGAATGVLKFARVAVVGNSWRRGQGGDPATLAGPIGSEVLTVTPVNSVDNPTYTPIYNAGGDASAVFNDLYGSVSNLQKLNNAKNVSEQALQLAFTGLTPGATVYTKRVFSTAIDISQHRIFNFLLYGNADPNNVDTTGKKVFFLRAGTDQNYYEVQVPLNFRGWKKISVKQTDPGNGVTNTWVSDTPGTVIVSTGAPSLQQVGELVAGVYDQRPALSPAAQGSVFLNEIHLAQPITRVGQAHKLQADFEYKGWGTFGFKQKAIDRNFQTPTSVVSNQDRRDDNAYLNLTRLSWMPLTMSVSRSVTDTPSTVQTGNLSNLVNLLQQGKVTTWNGAANANVAYGAYPRVNMGYTRNVIDYDILTRRDDRQNYNGTLQYGVPLQKFWLPRTLDANVARTMYDVRFKSDFARAQPNDFDTSERGITYGGRLTFTPWSGSSFNPTFTRTKTTERRTDYSSGAPVDSSYPKSLNQSMGFSSNFRLRSWFNPQVNYQIDTIENNILSISTIVVNTTFVDPSSGTVTSSNTYVFQPGEIKTVNRSANGSISLPVAIADLLPKSRLLHSLNIVSGYQLQDGDVWNNVEKGLDSTANFFVRQPLRPSNPAAQRANLTQRDLFNSTQRWSPLDGYALTGRLAALRTISVSNNYVLSIQRSEVTGTRSKTITRTLPDLVASISQLEQLWHTNRWMANTQMNFKYSRRTTENVGTSLGTENSFGSDIRSVVLKKYDTSLSVNVRRTNTKDLLVDANTQKTAHEDASGQVTFDVRKFRFTPKVDYSRDVTSLGTGAQTQNVTVITPSVLMRADLALPSGLRLPGSSRPLLFTNRIIWTTTLSLAQRRSPITTIDNSRLLSLNTSADYELAKNLRMTLNGSAQRLWHLYLPEESYLSYALGTTLTFQF
jgi:hypothetical protein